MFGNRKHIADLEVRIGHLEIDLRRAEAERHQLVVQLSRIQAYLRQLTIVLHESGILRFPNKEPHTWISVRHLAKRVTALSNQTSLLLKDKEKKNAE